MPDLTKLALHSNYPAFKNDNIYTGQFQLSSANITASGVVTQTFTVTLDVAPTIIEAMFKNDAESRWFKSGYDLIVQSGTVGGSPTDLLWDIDTEIDGLVVTITASAVKTFTDTFSPDSAIPVEYRIIDYSSL